MDIPIVLLAAAGLVVIGINVVATIAVTRSYRYDIKQKWAQALFIWLVPIIGGVLAWTLAKDSKSERTTLDLSDRGGNDDGHIRLDNYSSHHGDVSGHDSHS